MPPIVAAAAITGGALIGASAIQSSAQKKAAANAADLAREQQATALEEQKRLEEKYGLTQGELAREQTLLGIPQGEEAIKMVAPGLENTQLLEKQRQAGMTGEEILREQGGPDTQGLMSKISQRSGMTGEELFKAEGEIPQALQEQVLAGAKEPGKGYEDTLAQQLELARTMVNQEANRRGVFGGTPEGGIRFENLGRAGVDLAVKSAAEKMNQKQQDIANASTLATLFQNLSSSARGEQAQVSERALTASEKARAELDNFLANLQNQSNTAKGRAANVAVGSSANAQNVVAGGYNTLQGLEGYKGTIQSPASAGLSAIGQLGTQYLTDSIASATKKETNYEDMFDALYKAKNKYSNPIEETSALIGNRPLNEYVMGE